MFTLGIVFASLAAGYAFRRLNERQRHDGQGAAALSRLRQVLQLTALFVCMPLAAMLSLWGLNRPDARLLTLPALGLVAWGLGGFFALLLGRLLRLDRAQTGSLYCCGTFTNIGAVGSLACLFLLGESSIALTALYRLCEEIYYFAVALPVARRFGEGGTRLFRRPFRSPLLYAVLAALACGIALNLLQVRRPEFLGVVASALVVISTVFFLFTIGLGLRLSRLGCYIRPCLAICGIKFLLVPACIIGGACMLGLGDADDGLALKTVAVLASMPVAMNALIPPSLFNLDLDLANACWIGSTTALIVVLPALHLLLPLL
ncbi:MAG: hypothetical protein E7022_03500 [Desulfovibrio desulfuricans]|jgi:hypothetical protein|nr:hypothetical protein [Desulfovibrio desulfuricans]